jgi:hypothetical protein
MRWQKLAVMAVAFAALVSAATPCSADDGVSLTVYGPGEALSSIPGNDWTFDQTAVVTGLAPPDGSPLMFNNVAISHTLKFEVPPFPPDPTVGRRPVVGTKGEILRGEMTCSTPDGATLHGKYAGSFVRVSGGFVSVNALTGDVLLSWGGPSYAVLTAEVKLDRGTGGLQGVTGTAHMVIQAIGLSNPSFVFTMAGTLKYPNRP